MLHYYDNYIHFQHYHYDNYGSLMTVQWINVSNVIPDNDIAYFSLLEGVVDSLDARAQMSVTRSLSAYHFRIIPSDARLLPSLIGELNTLHNLLNMKVEYSKSIKSSAVITYFINI